MQIRVEAAKRTPNNRCGASRRKINQDIKEAGDDVDVVVGYLNQCYHGISLNQSRIKVITAPIKWNRGWGLGNATGVGVAEVPDKQISLGKTDNYPMWSRWSIYISARRFPQWRRAQGFKLKCCLRRYLNPQWSLFLFVFRILIKGKKTVRRNLPYLPTDNNFFSPDVKMFSAGDVISEFRRNYKTRITPL